MVGSRDGHVARASEIINPYKISDGQSEEKREDVKIDLKEIGWDMWTGLIWFSGGLL